MPMQRERYPDDWEAISLAVRAAAQWRCEWCGIAQGAQVIGRKGTPYKIVLTVAHLGTPHDDGTPGDPHDKMDVRRKNLAALCQPCHLRYDMPEHRRNAARNRFQRKIDAGQQLLPLVEVSDD